MISFNRKNDLGITDNKKIIIESLKGISIKKFRLIKNQEFLLGKNITVVSGRNGTMKSTIMGLVAHPFETNEVSITGEIMKTSFSEVFKLSIKKDIPYEYDIKMDIIHNGKTEHIAEPVKMYKRSDRFRLVPSGSAKGDGFFNLPSVYLNLKRLYPLVDIEDKDISELNLRYSEREKQFISKFYERIFGKTEFSTFQTYKTDKSKVSKTPIGPGTEATYDIMSISSGEDNLSSFLKILLSFMRVAEKKENKKSLTGLLSIDEFEASLHPIAQLNLFNFLMEWSAKYNVQIVLNTHSLYLIQEVMKKQTLIDNNSICINFITNRYSSDLQIYRNPTFKFAKEELTLTSEHHTDTLVKAKILCEDLVAEQYLKKIMTSQISKRCEFISNVSGGTGASWPTLKALAKNGYALLSDSMALLIFDADINESQIGNTKYSRILFIPSISEKKLPLEKEIVNYILNLSADDNFFKTVNKSKDMFKQEFSQLKIPLTTENIETENVNCYKRWFENCPKIQRNKYRDYMIQQNKDVFDKFKNELKKTLNEIFEENGVPGI
ncbi:hypothetical protein LJFMMFNO_00929 [Streptococcus equi subsp. zooepidemicus]|uniref:AAA family ATPase n=1 Tax=Streptococcus equi TaxID=1336 RepID=UPI001BEEB037|nr:AAA family ATPase [Streptococcus equi]QUQ79924.1 hypothetical protein LJFMMFNO_00929 [Streptococcus equi subsp. zooepidemicus]